jgi:hypothetical protein
MTHWSRRAWILIAMGVLFGVWSVWLMVQAAHLGAPELVSEPQLLVAPLVVVARIEGAGGAEPITAFVESSLKGEELLPPDRRLFILDWSQAQGAEGVGRYLLALQPHSREKATYMVAPVPVSPGHYYQRHADVLRPVYPYTSSIERQARTLLKRESQP